MQKAMNTPHEWSEDRLQAEFYIRFHNKFPQFRGLLFSVPNGGARGGLQAKIFQATGLYPGVADMVFLFNRVAYFIEFKRPDGKGSQSPAQAEWQKTVQSQGFTYIIFNDLEEAWAYVLNIIIQAALEKRDKDNFPHKQLNLEL